MRIKIATANLDFTNRVRETRIDLTKIRNAGAKIILFQEGKNVDVDANLPSDWITHQNLSDKAKKGVGITFKRGSVKPGARGYRLGTEPKGAKMLSRYIAWRNFEINQDGKSRKVKFMSVHLPPKRYAWLQPAMLNAIAVFVIASRIPVVVGGDWNMLVKRSDRLKKFARRTGGTFYGRGIDGFIVVNKRGSKWAMHSIDTISTNSDHDALFGILAHK